MQHELLSQVHLLAHCVADDLAVRINFHPHRPYSVTNDKRSDREPHELPNLCLLYN